MRTIIEKIIRAGVLAPSVDNLQPWRFEVCENTILIYGVVSPKEDFPVRQFSYAHYVSYGALIENIIIAADHFGYVGEMSIFPTPSNILHIATITLVYDPVDRGVNLFESIKLRATDRRKYRIDPLDKECIEELCEVPKQLGMRARVIVREDRGSIKQLARLTMLQIKIIFSKKDFHAEFFQSLRWNKQSAYRTKDGLDAITLELSLLKQILFRYIFGAWPVMAILSNFNMHSLAAFLEESRGRQAGAYIGIVLPSSEKVDYLNAGRIFERVWLLATRHGVSIQPTFAPLLIQQVLDAEVRLFTHAECLMIENSTHEYQEIFGVSPSEELMCVMRAGKQSGAPRRSLRKDPEIVFKEC